MLKMKLLKSESGLAMPLVLVVMLVLALLTTALWHYGNMELKQATLAENKTRAYYLARVGAESLALHIRQNSEIIDDILAGDTYNITEDSFNFSTDYIGEVGEIRASVELIDADADIYRITGIGDANGISETVSIVIDSRLYDGADDIVVLGNLPLELAHNLNLQANVLAKVKPNSFPNGFTKVGEGVYSDGTYYIYYGEEHFPFDDDYFKSVTMPADLTAYSPIRVRNESLDIPAGSRFYFEDITHVNANYDFIINTTASTDTVIVVDTMSTKTTIQVKGTGRAYIYVLSSASLDNPHGMTEVDTNAQLFVYLFANSYLDLHANASFYGHVYGPDATVRMHSAQTEFHGTMLAGVFRSGNQSAANIRGKVIALENEEDFFDRPIVNLLYWEP